MSTIVSSGLAAVTVTSASEVDILTDSPLGIGVNKSVAWRLTVNSTQAITVRVYLAAGPNCGLTLVSGYTSSVGVGGVLVISEAEYPLTRIRVTAQATGADSEVNCDLLMTSTFSN